ncbi:hypothetical protein AVEN_261124-1 [Araneus ventricosus]|uniref:Uncharacterized protein n=1 Tax=Araneus ventricosus TaxID=182803 RepID=A0A4Y2JHH7_ARAVE|nr:hypothetical protein AVEN_261124-1 [Araneus ventricosus]
MVNYETLHCFHAFTKATLSRFVKLSLNPSYFQFMVLCSMAMRITLEVFHDLRCFTFVKVISLCLIGVYDRCYKDLFRKNEESESLGSYCERINSSLLSRDGRSQLPVGRHQKMISLLSSLENVDYENFLLTETEMKMLEDILNLVLSEGISKASTDILGHSHFPWIDANEEEEAMDSSNLDEQEDDSSRVNGIVKYCDGSCFNFVLSYMREVLQKVNL